MCDRPIFIDNPYKGLKHVGLNYLHDTKSLKLAVPCGNCPTCIALRQNYYIQRTQMESIGNHLFMLTLTYKDSMIRTINVNGRKLYYPDWTDVQKMFKRLRNRGLSFRYQVVSEYGSRHHRPHFHAIISVPKGPKDTYHDIKNLEEKLSNMFACEWKRNYGSDRKPIYKDLCCFVFSFKGRTFDLHWINPSATKEGESDVAFYVTKYLLKADKWVDRLKSALKLNLKPDEFEKVWKLLKPRTCISKGFGDYNNPFVRRHIRKGIELAITTDSLFPFFINPVNGNTFPLSPFYQRRFMTLDDKLHFFSKSEYDDGYNEAIDRNPTKESLNDSRLLRIRKNVNSRLTTYDFINDSEIENLSAEALEKDIGASIGTCDLSDDWQNDFVDTF